MPDETTPTREEGVRQRASESIVWSEAEEAAVPLRVSDAFWRRTQDLQWALGEIDRLREALQVQGNQHE